MEHVCALKEAEKLKKLSGLRRTRRNEDGW